MEPKKPIEVQHISEYHVELNISENQRKSLEALAKVLYDIKTNRKDVAPLNSAIGLIEELNAQIYYSRLKHEQ